MNSVSNNDEKDENQSKTISTPPHVITPTVQVEWVVSHELSYEADNSVRNAHQTKLNVCFHCGRTQSVDNKLLLRCGKCKVATYCSKECQISDWNKKSSDEASVGVGQHKLSCGSYARIGSSMQLSNNECKEDARNDIIHRVRFYIFPYAVYKESELGPGFLFIQSDDTLATMSLMYPKDCYGLPLSKSRSLIIHYLTFAEYDMEVCRDDFEMAIIRSEVKDAISVATTNDPSTHRIVVVTRFRCGNIAVGISPFVPDYNVCHRLGQDYYSSSSGNGAAGALQLNIDDEM
jgi:MYND finger